MKKIKKAAAFILALTAAFGTCTACGKTDDGSAPLSSKDNAVSTVSEAAPEVSNEQYEEIMRKIVDSSSVGDYENTLDLIVPGKLKKPMVELRAMEDYLTINADDITDIKVASVQEASADESLLLGQVFTVFTTAFEEAVSTGISYAMITGREEVPEELTDDFNEIADYIDMLEYPDKCHVEPTIAIDYMMLVTYDMGGVEMTVPVYGADGESMRADILFYPLVSMMAAQNSNMENYDEPVSNIIEMVPQSVYYAFYAALEELGGEQNKDVSGLQLICSDSSKNVLTGKFGDILDDLVMTAGLYLADMDNYDYALIINNGIPVFCAISDGNAVYTHPGNTLPKGSDGTVSVEVSENIPTNFDNVYSMCADAVK